MSTTTPRTVHHVAPVPDGDLDHQLGALVHLGDISTASDRLASIEPRLASIDATLARAIRLATVAGGVAAGAAVIAAAALVIGEVRR